MASVAGIHPYHCNMRTVTDRELAKQRGCAPIKPHLQKQDVGWTELVSHSQPTPVLEEYTSNNKSEDEKLV